MMVSQYDEGKGIPCLSLISRYIDGIEDQPLDPIESKRSKSRSPDDQWNPDIVDAYADRLGAVMHAFSLCCKVMAKEKVE